MTQQVVNVGTGPDTGTGNPLRTAFQKLNSNDTELYQRTSLVTPLEYGAIGNGSADDTSALASAAATGKCLIPAGYNFLTTAPIQVPSGGIFVGQCASSVITGSGVTGGVVQVGDGTIGHALNCTVGNFSIAGTGTQAFKMNAVYESVVWPIWATGAFTDGFWFDQVFGCNIGYLSTHQATISASCFKAGGAFNANNCGGWYTSNLDSPYNFFFEDFNSTGQSGGNYFGMLAAQGGRIGVYGGANWRGNTVAALYTENTVRPLVLGDTAGGKQTGAWAFTAPILGGPLNTHPSFSSRIALIDFDYVVGATIDAPSIQGSYGATTIAPLSFSSGGTGAIAWAVVKPTGVISYVFLKYGGTGYSGTPTVTIGGVGTGATITCTQSGGAINSLTLTAGGSGFVNAPPVPIRYQNAYRCQISNPDYVLGDGSNHSLLWPWVTRHTSAASDSGVAIMGDFPNDTGPWNNATATFQKADQGSWLHYLTYLNSGGTQTAIARTPPVFP